MNAATAIYAGHDGDDGQPTKPEAELGQPEIELTHRIVEIDVSDLAILRDARRRQG